MKKSNFRRRITLVGLGLVALAWGMAREPVMERLAREYAARRLIRLWGLPRTRAFRQQFRQGLSEPVRPVLDFDLMFTGGPGPNEGSAPFSRRYDYEDLWEGGRLKIGVFTEDIPARAQLRAWLEKERGAFPKGLSLEIGETRAEFLDALTRCDMVIFFGHANLGRGIQLGNTGDTEHWLAMAPAVIEIHRSELRPGEMPIAEQAGGRVQIRAGHAREWETLDVQCKILWLLGCRTEAYYRSWLTTHVPPVDLVTTHYELDTTSYAVSTLQILMRALDERRPIDQVIDAMNRGRTLDLMRAMYAESLRQGLRPQAPFVLYIADAPAP